MRITANQVTFSRIALMPVVGLLLYGGPDARMAAWFLGGLVALTDLVDGWLARKHGPTVLGGLMDPIADKVFIAIAFLGYADLGWVPWWFPAAILLREFVVTSLRSSFEVRKKTLQTTYLAKVKTWIQMQASGIILGLAFLTSETLIVGLMAGFAIVAALAWLVLRVVFRRTWVSGLIGVVGMSVTAAVYVVGGREWFDPYVWATAVLLTWISGADYLVVGARELLFRRRGHAGGRLTLFDAVRLAGAVAIPVLAPLALGNVGASAWALVGVVSLELAIGGLDNLLAHHGVAPSSWSWGWRVGGVSALLGASLLFAELAPIFAVAALAVSLIGTVLAFWRNRRFYLEERLREERSLGAPVS